MKRLSLLLLFTFLLFTACIKGGNNISAKKILPSNDPTGPDPLASLQWHFNLLGTSPVWAQGNFGDDVLVAIVDDGLQISHPDLVSNIMAEKSYNYVTGSSDPSPTQVTDGHGTSVAGIIGARDNNAIGVKGIASRSKLIGFNLLSSDVSADTNMEVNAMTRLCPIVSVSNNSWGFSDDLGTFDAPSPLWEAGVETGLTYGRGGKGTIYVWAAGNGGRTVDLSNYDGRASFYGVISVCGIGNDDTLVNYSEHGANLWVCAPTMHEGVSTGIVTTDLVGDPGFNRNSTTTDLSDKNYTKKFNGTSASAPMVSGVVALMLKANPNLTWRDVKWILAKTARKNDPTHIDWTVNAANVPISYSYGFGAVSASVAVSSAKTWANLPAEKIITSNSNVFDICDQVGSCTSTTAGADIDDAGHEVRSIISLADTGIEHIEYVDVIVEMTHANWGNLWISLDRVGNTTTKSALAFDHNCYDYSNTAIRCTVPANSFRFGSARHLDEPADGFWMLRVADTAASDSQTGTMTSWSMVVRGH